MATQSLICFVDLYFTRCHRLNLDEHFPILFLKLLSCHYNHLKPELTSTISVKTGHKSSVNNGHKTMAFTVALLHFVVYPLRVWWMTPTMPHG